MATSQRALGAGTYLSLLAMFLIPIPRLSAAQPSRATVRGTVRDYAGKSIPSAELKLTPRSGSSGIRTSTDAEGKFSFTGVEPGLYTLSLLFQGEVFAWDKNLELHEGGLVELAVEIPRQAGPLSVRQIRQEPEATVTGEQRLSSQQVSSLPLNKRDFSQLLVLAAGTMTDTNGAANFTQQFAVNGQRGTTAVFYMDRIYITDPELGGATFSNFNVDAIQEIRSVSGVLPAEMGGGAAAVTDIITKSGSSQVHGSVFEFVRNAAFDARNFFDRRSKDNPHRLPAFVRNEFGFTLGGPVRLPGLWDGRGQTFYFGEYQGFRQVLGTTQELAVPTPAERQGIDTTTFPGDTLMVPVSLAMAPVLGRYPLPNDLEGPFGARTFATSSRVTTDSDQLSARIDHRISEQQQWFARFTWDNTNGPITNPSQATIDPSFAIQFFDHQQNAGLSYTRSFSPNLQWEFSLGFLRTTPFFRASNPSQPGLILGDGTFEPFNAASGSITGAYGNLFQIRQDLTAARGSHSFKAGFEARFNRDTTIFGTGPNGTYTFGGGRAYSPVSILSASGQHDIRVGDPLPDALTGFLTATPFSFTASVAPPAFAQGDHIGESAIRREAYDFYFQDDWKATPYLKLSYGLRYEADARFHEAQHRTSGPVFTGAGGLEVPSWTAGVREHYLYYPQPAYHPDWGGWGPRLSLEWHPAKNTVLRAGSGITTVLPNLFQDDFLTGGFPFVVYPFLTARPNAPVAFSGSVTTFNFPPIHTEGGQLLLASGPTTAVPANTGIDLLRFEQDLAAATPGGQVQPLLATGMERSFRNGYIESYTAGFEQVLGEVTLDVSYVGTAGVKIPSIISPNAYPGAVAGFAPFTLFDAGGNVEGGYGPEYLMSSRSHSTFHSLQASASKSSARAGFGFQASYTFSKSLDDTSNVLGGFGFGSTPTVIQAFPQDPHNPGTDKGASTFDVRHVVAFSLIQKLPFDEMSLLRPLGKSLTSGWEFLNISTLTSGPPFSVFSGIQQTGWGTGGGDRPDLVAPPALSTSRSVREDYFGRGASNPGLFFIPIGVPGGTGPNQGRFGSLGRNTFRGPSFHEFDVALIKDTPIGHRGRGEALTAEFRAEFFNVFNAVNFGLPSNIVSGSGFGLISRTAGPSRQIQLSMKIIY